MEKTPQHVQLATPPGSLLGPLLLSSSWACLTSFQQETDLGFAQQPGRGLRLGAEQRLA